MFRHRNDVRALEVSRLWLSAAVDRVGSTKTFSSRNSLTHVRHKHSHSVYRDGGVGCLAKLFHLDAMLLPAQLMWLPGPHLTRSIVSAIQMQLMRARICISRPQVNNIPRSFEAFVEGLHTKWTSAVQRMELYLYSGLAHPRKRVEVSVELPRNQNTQGTAQGIMGFISRDPFKNLHPVISGAARRAY